MAFKTITIIIDVERITYIKGSFFGKYRGKLDSSKINSEYEQFYDINIYEGEIFDFEIESNNSKKINSNTYEKFQSEMHFFQDAFDNIISKSLKKNSSNYDVFRLKIHKPKLQEITIDNVIKDDKQTFGTFTAIVFGYIIDLIQVEEEIEVEICDDCNQLVAECSCETKGTRRDPEEPDDSNNLSENFGCLSIFSFLGYLILALLAIGFLYAIGIKGIITVLIIGAVIFLFSYFSVIGRFISWGLNLIFRILFNLIGLFFIFALILGLLSLFKGSFKNERKRERVTNVEEKSTTKPIPESMKNDTIISHHRIWKDYNDNIYEGDLDILKTDYTLSYNNRQNTNYQLRNNYSWSNMYSNLINFDKEKLNRIYLMFNQIQKENKLNSREFAEVIVSCVQDIDYSLVLQKECNPYLYQDKFIREYLSECNECCIGNIKYGVQSPVEFMTNLYGDCDTRTILLYTILSKFGYDVVVLGSMQYQHSILGINLPYQGKYKVHNGKKYYVWETTSVGFTPGIIPPHQANMNLWNIHLTNKKS
mgnify:CR=1 FL=1|jgi:hypothetical protein|tara:strand:- start:885 stop:2489 length:1605 start_codon:yes stop_codon:yes gene_type:complete